MKLSRRSFLLANIVTFSSLFALNSANSKDCVRLDQFLYKFLAKNILDEQEVIEVGLSYRAQNTGDRFEECLHKLIESNYENLDKHVRNDFKNNCSISIMGWHLSITEAQLCAMYSTRVSFINDY